MTLPAVRITEEVIKSFLIKTITINDLFCDYHCYRIIDTRID
jgi:hypothetical protein